MKWSWSGRMFCNFSQSFTSWVRVNILFGIFIVALYILVLHTVFRAVLWIFFYQNIKTRTAKVQGKHLSFEKIILKPKLPHERSFRAEGQREEIIWSWANYHLKRIYFAKTQKEVTSFTDFRIIGQTRYKGNRQLWFAWQNANMRARAL